VASHPEGRGPTRFRRVTVLGPGLLGGSLLLAARARGVADATALWARRPEAVAEAAARGVADCCTGDLGEAVGGSDLVVLCTPVGVMPALAAALAPMLDGDALVTDVGSVKAAVAREVGPALGADRFVGSHPMAGSERSGLDAARADLFEGAVCIVTPLPATPPAAVDRVSGLWSALGGAVRTLDPDTHDRVIARASHLPHLLASALVNYVCGTTPDPLQFAGNGFRDTTRVASGPAALWREILSYNRGHVREAITGMISELEQAKRFLDSPDDGRLEAFLGAAKRERDRIGQGRGHGGD
jgi:prephenate dehydrogenase